VKTKDQVIEEEWGRCCYLSSRLPGDNIEEVRNGPLRQSIPLARFRHIYLPRVIKRARVNPDISNRWRRHLAKLRRVGSTTTSTSTSALVAK
jgi:hypothetical protein